MADKYMMTPRGMFEFKFFFANSVSVMEGETCLSVDTVRHRLRQLIDGETSTNILSDQAIMDTLRSEGIDVARRTVAKYREMMEIPTSRKPKWLKAPLLAGARTLSQAGPSDCRANHRSARSRKADRRPRL